MRKIWKHFGIEITCTALFCSSTFAADPPITILNIELANETLYVGDVSDYSKLASDPNPVPPAQPSNRNFGTTIVIADIVLVNGKPAKGTMIEHTRAIRLSPNPTAGVATADTTRYGIYDFNFEFQRADGAPIGSIRSGGAGQGPPPPGAIKTIASANHPILGGTGAFLGVRGYQGAAPGSTVAGAYQASVAEDPINRRSRGGGPAYHTMYIIPMFWPEVVTTANGPAVVHSTDFSLVTSAKPARGGEILSLFATGLGPTNPGLEAGAVFAASPLQVATSPIEVFVGDQSAEVLYAGGYPGTTSAYQVNFRMPPGIAPGMANLRMTAAWIGGSTVQIPVQ